MVNDMECDEVLGKNESFCFNVEWDRQEGTCFFGLSYGYTAAFVSIRLADFPIFVSAMAVAKLPTCMMPRIGQIVARTKELEFSHGINLVSFSIGRPFSRYN